MYYFPPPLSYGAVFFCVGTIGGTYMISRRIFSYFLKDAFLPFWLKVLMCIIVLSTSSCVFLEILVNCYFLPLSFQFFLFFLLFFLFFYFFYTNWTWLLSSPVCVFQLRIFFHSSFLKIYRDCMCVQEVLR